MNHIGWYIKFQKKSPSRKNNQLKAGNLKTAHVHFQTKKSPTRSIVFFNENPRKIKKQAYPCRKRDSWLISWPFIMAAEKSQNRLKRDTKSCRDEKGAGFYVGSYVGVNREAPRRSGS